ncbi:hypothetical protein [Rothia nasisuis]|uniref:hypothetical protein n=1 Tax=Rothia nasisuis TaxID=2109647 RepID=UPI001F3EC3E1|nr:hypothetical protein [Rothia nasisuis]
MANNPYERLTIAIEEASDNPADVDWVQTAFATLASNYVKAVTSESALQKVIRQITETGESAAELYGSPQDWATEKITSWREKGTQAFATDEPLTLRAGTISGFFVGAIFSLLFWLMNLLPSDSPSDQPLGFYLLPVVLGFAVIIPPVIFRLVRAKAGFTAGALVTALIVLLLACGIGFSLFWSYEVVTATFPAWFHVVVATGSALLGSLATVLLPKRLAPSQEDTDNYSEPATWLERFTQELWNRGDISDARVREEVSRVKEHVAEGGGSYLEEFGHPATYARSLSHQKVVKPYRLYLYSLLMIFCIGYWGYGVFTTQDTASQSWRLPLLIVVFCAWALELCKNYRAYRQTKTPSSS